MSENFVLVENFDIPENAVPIIHFSEHGFTLTFRASVRGGPINQIALASLPKVVGADEDDTLRLMQALIDASPPPPEAIMQFDNSDVLQLLIEQLINLFHEMRGVENAKKAQSEEAPGVEELPWSNYKM